MKSYFFNNIDKKNYTITIYVLCTMCLLGTIYMITTLNNKSKKTITYLSKLEFKNNQFIEPTYSFMYEGLSDNAQSFNIPIFNEQELSSTIHITINQILKGNPTNKEELELFKELCINEQISIIIKTVNYFQPYFFYLQEHKHTTEIVFLLTINENMKFSFEFSNSKPFELIDIHGIEELFKYLFF